MNMDVIDATAEALPLELLNAVNKELTAQLSRGEQLLEEKVREVEDQRRRLQFMKEHLSNVRGEIVNTQSLVECKRREVESEVHMCRVIDRECGRLRQGRAQMQAQQAETHDQLQAVQNRVFQENLRMAELKEAMAFNQEELEQWDVARKQKEADEEAVARYAKNDEVRVRQLKNAVERLETRLRDRRRELQEEVMATHGVQVELDHSAADYRRLHSERGTLLNDWERVVKSINERDAAIRTAAAQYGEGVEWLEQRRAVLKGLSDELEAARKEMADVEVGIKEREQRAERDRGVLTSLGSQVSAMEVEEEALCEMLARAVRDRNNSRISAEQSRAAVSQKTEAYNRALDRLAHTKKQLLGECDTAQDLAKQQALIARLLQEARTTDRQLDREVEDLKREQFAASERLAAALRQRDDYIVEISGGQAHLRNLKLKVGQLDSESFSQQKILYSVEFNVQQMQRKVSFARGERTEDERLRLNEKIAALQSTLEDLSKQWRALDTQVKRVREETRQANVEVAKLQNHERAVSDKTLQLRLGCDGCTAELRRLRKTRENELVRVDTQELQLQGLKRTLHQRNDELGELDWHKQQLSLDVSQRLAEIAVHHDLLRMEAKLAEEERRRLVAELQERRKSLSAMCNSYDTRMCRVDPEEAYRTQAELVMEAAREREELQRKGDALDARVSRMERELRKMEHTLSIIRASNSSYRQMFKRVKEDDEEVVTRRALQRRHRELKALISRRTLEVSEYEEVLRGKTAEVQQAAARKERTVGVLKDLRQALSHAHDAILEDREAVIRYDQAIARARSGVTADVAKDVELLERRQRLDAAAGRALQLAQQHSESAGKTARELLFERWDVC